MGSIFPKNCFHFQPLNHLTHTPALIRYLHPPKPQCLHHLVIYDQTTWNEENFHLMEIKPIRFWTAWQNHLNSNWNSCLLAMAGFLSAQGIRLKEYISTQTCIHKHILTSSFWLALKWANKNNKDIPFKRFLPGIDPITSVRLSLLDSVSHNLLQGTVQLGQLWMPASSMVPGLY